jgi:hypothetical protein
MVYYDEDCEMRCACGKKTYKECRMVEQWTFTEKYECGYVDTYSNTNGLEERLIEIDGKRVW